MKLLTKQIIERTSEMLDNDGLDAHKVKVTAKFFDPMGSFTWYLTELNKENLDDAYGFVTSEFCPEGELGYFSIKELEEITLPLGLGIERDKYFQETNLMEVMMRVGS